MFENKEEKPMDVITSGAAPVSSHLENEFHDRKRSEIKGSNSSSKIVALAEPYSPISEQYRLLFSRLDRICKAEGKVIVAFTSSVKGEGKTTSISNMAVVAARDFKKRCLLIDADFKNPSVAKSFQLEPGLGLIDFMSKRCTLDSILVQSQISNLKILPVGHIENREEMIPNMDSLREIISKVRGQYYNVLWDESQGDFLQMDRHDIGMYDYVFIDTPPMVPVFDMNLISEVVDAIVFVVRAGATPKYVISKALKFLDKTKVIGSILNCANIPWAARPYEYGYYSY
ncbi:MAG: CpsD/CapB family tyrosine-protein kinase [Nitrospirota bacterium]